VACLDIYRHDDILDDGDQKLTPGTVYNKDVVGTRCREHLDHLSQTLPLFGVNLQALDLVLVILIVLKRNRFLNGNVDQCAAQRFGCVAILAAHQTHERDPLMQPDLCDLIRALFRPYVDPLSRGKALWEFRQ
jgi:hypothetical protein